MNAARRSGPMLPNGKPLNLRRYPGTVSEADRMRAKATAELRRRSRGRAAADPLSLLEFIEQAWKVVEPGTPFSTNWHLEAIAEHLEAITYGKLKDLIISMPPRMAKSRTVCVFWPAWEWAEVDPSKKWLFASYSHTLSKRDSVDCRRLIQSPWYRSRYAHVFSLVSDQNEKMRYENTRSGVRASTSVAGATTGEGGNRLVIDDPHNVKEVSSPTMLRTVHDWFDKSWISRRNNPKTDARLIVAQRTHPNDLTGHVLRNSGTGPDGWYHLVLPMEYNPTRRIRTVTPLEWEDPRVRAGQLLHPDRIGEKELEKMKKSMGDDYAAQYNQDPVPDGGQIVNPKWWNYWTTPPAGIEAIVISLDANFAEKKSDTRRDTTQKNSYACIQVWGRRGADKYLLERWRGRGFIDTKEQLKAIAERWTPYEAILIERAANGYAIIEELRSELHSIIPIKPTASKAARLKSVSPTIKAGNCYLPDPKALSGFGWVTDYVSSVAEHPHGVDGNDDGDATSQALNYFRGDEGSFEAFH